MALRLSLILLLLAPTSTTALTTTLAPVTTDELTTTSAPPTEVLTTILGDAEPAADEASATTTVQALTTTLAPISTETTTTAHVGDVQCNDTEKGATDTYGDNCANYMGNANWCGDFDDADFKASFMCCACGGGTTEASVVQHPLDELNTLFQNMSNTSWNEITSLLSESCMNDTSMAWFTCPHDRPNMSFGTCSVGSSSEAFNRVLGQVVRLDIEFHFKDCVLRGVIGENLYVAIANQTKQIFAKLEKHTRRWTFNDAGYIVSSRPWRSTGYVSHNVCCSSYLEALSFS